MGETLKNYWIFYAIKKIKLIFFLHMYKMVQINKEDYKECEIEIFCINIHDEECNSYVWFWLQL